MGRNEDLSIQIDKPTYGTVVSHNPAPEVPFWKSWFVKNKSEITHEEVPLEPRKPFFETKEQTASDDEDDQSYDQSILYPDLKNKTSPVRPATKNENSWYQPPQWISSSETSFYVLMASVAFFQMIEMISRKSVMTK